MPKTPTLYAASALAAVLLSSPAESGTNFLIVVADDVGVDAIGAYSRDDLYGHEGEGAAPGPTPNIDELAAGGILFRNAYTNPVCAPTRAQILTGRHGFRTGIGTPQGALLSTSELTLAELVAPTHRTAALGKWHLGDNNDAEHPIDSGFEYYAGGLRGGVDDYESWDKTVNSAGSPAQSFPAHATYATTDTANEAIAKIAEFGESPWFVWVAFNAGHSPFHVPPAELTTVSVTDDSNRPTKYRAAVEALDTELGRILSSLDPTTRAETTIIFIGDNGTPRQAVLAPFIDTRAKGSMYEGGINVPLIVSGPIVHPDHYGTESTALAASIDIFATVAELAGLEAAAEDSASMVPYLLDPTTPTTARRPYVYAERFTPNGFGPYDEEERSVRNETHKLIWRDGNYEELYNLDEDRFEQENLLPVEDLSAADLTQYLELVEAMEAVGLGIPSPTTTTTSTTTTTTSTTTTSTTTTTSSTTTTTVPTGEFCGDPDADDTISSTDALAILQAALGLGSCSTCICDVDGSGTVSASDALATLHQAVGLGSKLSCPVCQ